MMLSKGNMSPGQIRICVDNALDFIQLIMEDVESNFIEASISDAMKARAGITVSSLYVLSDYLRIIREGLEVTQ